LYRRLFLLSDGEISYQCSLKTCPLCKVVTEDTTSVCDCGFNFRTDLSESDYKLLRRAYQVEIRTFKTQVKLKLHFEKSKEDFTSALDKDIDKLSHVTWTLRGNLEDIKNPEFIQLIRAKGIWL